MQTYRKQTAAGIIKRRGRKEYVWQKEYIKHMYTKGLTVSVSTRYTMKQSMKIYDDILNTDLKPFCEEKIEDKS